MNQEPAAQFLEDMANAHILVCDDSLSDRAILRSILNKHFKNIELADDGEQALQRVHEDGFDLLLLDVEMPGKSGLEVARAIRASQPHGTYLPIILVTARTSQQDKLDGLQAGATDFLTKPYDPSELIARIRNHLTQKLLNDRLLATNLALQEERAKVQKVQLDLLPKEMPQTEGLEFAARYAPSEMASGDYYDVIFAEDGRILIAIGDVSGHGIPSAMHMSILRAILHTKIDEGAEIQEIVMELNWVLCHALNNFSFVTFYLAEFDPRSGKYSEVSAGHPPPLLNILADSSIRELRPDAGIPLGIDREFHLTPTTYELPKGSRIYLFTDGIFEQMNENQEFYGQERFYQKVCDLSSVPLQEACDGILESVRDFAGNQPIGDDITLLAMQRNG